MSNINLDQNKYLVIFHNTLYRMLTTLKDLMPEMNQDLKNVWQYYQSGRKNFIKELEANISPYLQDIINCNEELFSQDNNENCYLVPKLDFIKLWRQIHLVEFENRGELYKSKKALFTYLRKLYLLSRQAYPELEKFYHREVNKDQTILKLLDSFKLDREVKEQVEKIRSEEPDEDEGYLDKIRNYIKQIFGEETFNALYQVLDDIDENYLERLQSLENMEDIQKEIAYFSEKIGSKIQELINNGDLNLESIYENVLKMVDLKHYKEMIFTELDKLNKPEVSKRVEKILDQKPSEWETDDLEYLKEHLPIEDLFKRILSRYHINKEQRDQIFELFNQYKEQMPSNSQ